MAGGFVFGRVDAYQLSAADPDLPSGHPGFSYTQASWPRIDVAPAGIDATAWNQAIAAAAQKLAMIDAPAPEDQEAGEQASTGQAGTDQNSTDQDPGDDIDPAYNIGLVTPQMISVELTLSECGHGAAHPNGASEMHNVLLADGRELTATDLFRDGTDWQGYLVKRSHAAWEAIMEGGPDVDDNAIATVVEEPANWQLTNKGITVLFPLYSIGPYVVGEQQVDFTWDELKPYLVDKLPFTRP